MSDIVGDAERWLSSRGDDVFRSHSEHCHRRHVECLVARLVADVKRHRMTPEERGSVAAAAEEFAMLASVNDEEVAQWHIGRARALRAYLDRTEPEGRP